MGKKTTASAPLPTIVIKKEPNNEPMRPEPPRPEPSKSSPSKASPSKTSPPKTSLPKISPPKASPPIALPPKPSPPKESSSIPLPERQKIDLLQSRLQRIKAAGLMEQCKPINSRFDADMKEARAKYTESRKPVARKNEQLLLNKPKKAKGSGTELEKMRYRDYQKQAAECARLFLALKTELATTTAALEKTRDDAVDRLLALEMSVKSPPVVPGSSLGNTSSVRSAPTPQPFRYTPVTPLALSANLPSRPTTMAQGSPDVLPLPGLRQVGREAMDVDRSVPSATKGVTNSARTPELKLPSGTMVFPNKVLRKAAGECILRCVIHILSRCFAYISRDLFKSLYREMYGTNIGNYSRFIQKPWKKFLDCTTTRKGSYYRLNPAFFLSMADSVKLPRLAMTNAGVFVELTDKPKVPPVTPMNPLLIKSLVMKLELSLGNLYTTDRELLPRNLPVSVPLQDFQKYLSIWNKVAPLPSHEAGSDQLPLPKKLKIGDVTPEIYDQYIEAATVTSGMQAKRTKKVLTAYSTKMMRPIEEQRQAMLNSSLGILSNTEGAEEKGDVAMMGISDQSDEQTQYPHDDAHPGVLPKTKRLEKIDDQDMSGTSDSSDGDIQPQNVHGDQEMRGDQEMSSASNFRDEGTQQSGAAHSDQDMSDTSDLSDGAIQKSGDSRQGTSTPPKAVDGRPSTTTTPTRFAPYPGRNIISAQKQGGGALVTASARKSDKEKATTVGAIRSQKDFFKRPVLSGSLQSSSENRSFSLPRPNLPDDPNRLPLPTWESQVRRGRFSGMSRHQLHEARKEAREFLIDWMWSLPLRHGRDYPNKVQM